MNKPFRPIPAQRISLSTARLLRWILIPACCLLSSFVGGLYAAIGFATLTLLYNELEWAGHWTAKNIVNAGFYAFFEIGATLIAAGGTVSQLLNSLDSLLIAPCSPQMDREDSRRSRLSLFWEALFLFSPPFKLRTFVTRKETPFRAVARCPSYILRSLASACPLRSFLGPLSFSTTPPCISPSYIYRRHGR